ncbi:MAG: nitroreductase family protein [Chlorobiaceae bacterium]|nr:nitroreductase family protein [Chlorobiaceae bacterium]
MSLRDLLTRSRSVRRFDGSAPVGVEVLAELVELAGLTPSAANRQPLRYLAVTEPGLVDGVFGCLKWAGYLTDWAGPEPAERAPAYLVMLCREGDAAGAACDSGIAAQTILLGAAERGLGGCIVGAINRERLNSVLDIPGSWRVLMVIALGRPVETIVIDLIDDGEDIRYYRDSHGIHHVPKRKPGDVLVTIAALQRDSR